MSKCTVVWVYIFLTVYICMACHSGTGKDSNKCRQPEEEFKALKTEISEKKYPEAMAAIKQFISRLPADDMANDSLQHYCRIYIDAFFNITDATKTYAKGIEYIDSLHEQPFLRTYCHQQLTVTKAHLFQLLGDKQNAVSTAEKYLALPPETDNGLRIQNLEMASCVYYYCSDQIGKAISLLEQAAILHQQGAEFKNMGRVFSRLSSYYRQQGQYEKAVSMNQEAISSFDDSQSPINVMVAYGEQADIYAELGLYEQALSHNAQAVRYSLQMDSLGLGDVFRNRAAIFKQMENRDSLFYYLQLAKSISALQGKFKGIFISNIELLNAYTDYPDSIAKALQLAEEVCRDTAGIPLWAKSQLKLYNGKAFIADGKLAEGVRLVKAAAEDFEKSGWKENEIIAHTLLMDAYRKQGMNEQFAYYYEKTKPVLDSLASMDVKRAVIGNNIRYETERKEQENNLLTAKVELQQQASFYQISLIVLLLLLLVSSIAYMLIRHKASRLLVEKKEREIEIQKKEMELNQHEIERLINRQQELNLRNEQLSQEIEKALADNNLEPIRTLTAQSIISREDEEQFKHSFAVLHPNYIPVLREKFPQLTRSEELLSMLISMNHTSAEIALFIGINPQSVNIARSRLRKKLNLQKGESLEEHFKALL
ncbi:tetratricopeptide repeat protein [Oscillospiraceae bacterium N12]|jgi:tetratricopeptide (TPR) repeat protein|uniref:Tetratricopeptide repeat protein n=1 Tax=Jilunia laotingensis TaxID=2763675 RepID=A0A926F6X4_9BACT|nr:hypothetical protein [Jilunia laotingensis]MBC8593167.1 tetratricopeptide repeat protein [Jilunia laotingensis]